MHVFADGISRVTFSSGNLRIQLVQRGANNENVEAGTLIIPASQANNFMNGLANSMKELDSKLKEAREQQQSESQTQK